MALGSNQPLTEMSTAGLTTLPPEGVKVVLNPSGPVQVLLYVLNVKSLNKTGHTPTATYITQQKHWIIFPINFNCWFLPVLLLNVCMHLLISLPYLSSKYEYISFYNVQGLREQTDHILRSYLASSGCNSLLLQRSIFICGRRSVREHCGRHIHISFCGSSLQIPSIYSRGTFQIAYTCNKGLHMRGRPGIYLLREPRVYLNDSAVLFTAINQ